MKKLILLAFLGLSIAAKGQNLYEQCEDTCTHVHGIDLSHYQGEVFWETVGENTKMAYVYLKATEGGDRIDERYENNITLAHKYGLKVGSYHYYRPKTEQQKQLENFMTQCRPGEQDLIPMIDIETKSGLPTEEFCDSLLKFLDLVEQTYKQKPLLYTFTNFYNKWLVGKIDGREPSRWQATCTGRSVGVNRYIDQSMFVRPHGLKEIRYRHK